MLNLGQLANTVQKNCHISDARHAGDYSLCIFLLKMREFYRWENEIPLTHSLPQEGVGKWLQEREQMWDRLESSPFEPLPMEYGVSDPFDDEPINRELIPQGYVYSGGYGHFSKPHFFLGNLLSKEIRAGFTIYTSSCEYARDLAAPPAMLQGRTIYLRQESVRRFLWEKIDEWNWNQKNNAMERALASYKYDSDMDTALDQMTLNESETMILHELGEGQAGGLLGEEWNRMLAALSRSKAEIMARAVRDILADCISTLPSLIENEKAASLHFYFANFGGIRKHLFPEALDTYHRWVNERDLKLLHQLVSAGKSRWLDTAHTMLELYKKDGKNAGASIEHLLEKGSI